MFRRVIEKLRMRFHLCLAKDKNGNPIYEDTLIDDFPVKYDAPMVVAGIMNGELTIIYKHTVCDRDPRKVVVVENKEIITAIYLQRSKQTRGINRNEYS